jgi:proline iminopeptidase
MYSVSHPVSEGRSRTILSVDAINMAFGGFLRSYDIRDQLHKVTVPTLVIGARHDWICQPEFSEEIASSIPNSELRIFENSGHLIRLDEPQALLTAISEFIAKK